MGQIEGAVKVAVETTEKKGRGEMKIQLVKLVLANKKISFLANLKKKSFLYAIIASVSYYLDSTISLRKNLFYAQELEEDT